jgi:hypothetical protein
MTRTESIEPLKVENAALKADVERLTSWVNTTIKGANSWMARSDMREYPGPRD